MRFDFDQAQRAAARRMRDNLDADVNAAYARIRRYTPTEHAEAALGLRPTQRDMELRRLTAGFEGLGRAWCTLIETARAVAEAVVRGFQKELNDE